MKPRLHRRVWYIALAMYAVTALAGKEIHLLTHHGAGGATAQQAAKHACGCGHCHGDVAVATVEHSEPQTGSTSIRGGERQEDHRVARHGTLASAAGSAVASCGDDCSVCANLAGVRLANVVAIGAEVGGAAGFSHAVVFTGCEAIHRCFAWDARGPPVA